MFVGLVRRFLGAEAAKILREEMAIRGLKHSKRRAT